MNDTEQSLTHLWRHEKCYSFAGHSTQKHNDEGHDVSNDKHQLFEPFHPFLSSLRTRVNVWRFDLKKQGYMVSFYNTQVYDRILKRPSLKKPCIA